MLVGIFIYSSWIAKMRNNLPDESVIGTPHASFGLCIAAAIGAVASGIMFAVSLRREQNNPPLPMN